MADDDPLVAVVRAADAAEPRRQTLDHMADTVRVAQDWLYEDGFRKVRVDRWEHPTDGMFVELGYVHGEVWFRAWKGSDTIRHSAETRKPGDIQPLVGLVHDVQMGLI